MKVFNWGEDGIATAAEAAAIRSSFCQEVAVWHKLDHPNVTKVNKLRFLAMSCIWFHLRYDLILIAVK